jgi:hypothetical protein
MTQPLISPGKLIDASWKMMLAEWRATLLYTVLLFVLPFILTFIGIPLLFVGMRAEETTLVAVGFCVFVILTVFVLAWPTLKLTRYLLEKDLGHALPTLEKGVSFALILSYLWIAFLTFLAVMLGYVVFIIPGIWLAGLLPFAYLYLLEDGMKGTKALQASADLVKGRWWKVFGRLFLAGLFAAGIAMGFSILISIVAGIIGSVARDSFISYILMLILQIGAQAVVTVLITLFSVCAYVKLFHSLKDSPMETPVPAPMPPSQPQM